MQSIQMRFHEIKTMPYPRISTCSLNSVYAAPRTLRFHAVVLCAFMLAAMPMTALASALPANLEDHSWLIGPPSWNEPQQWPTYGTIPKPAPYITFTRGTIRGSTGCGQLTGSYHRSEDRLTIAPGRSDAPAPL